MGEISVFLQFRHTRSGAAFKGGGGHLDLEAYKPSKKVELK